MALRPQEMEETPPRQRVRQRRQAWVVRRLERASLRRRTTWPRLVWQWLPLPLLRLVSWLLLALLASLLPAPVHRRTRRQTDRPC